MRQFSKYTSVLMLGLMSLSAWAQKDPSLNQEIVTVGERELKLKDAFKANFYPQEIDTVITKEDLRYDVIPTLYRTNFEPDTIKPARLKVVEPLNKLYPGYAKVGIGNFTMPMAELYLGSNRNRKGLKALKIRHLSSKGQERDNNFAAPFSETSLNAWLKTFSKKSAFSAQLYGSRNATVYRSTTNTFNDSLFSGAFKDGREMYTAGVKLNLASYHKKEEKINHDENLDVYYLTDNLGASELNFTAATTLEKFYNKELYKLDFSVTHNAYKYNGVGSANNFRNEVTDGNTVVNLRPHIFTTTEKIKADLGIRITAHFNQGRTYFYFFPSASFAWTPSAYFSPYLGVNGGTQLQTYRRLLANNPFFHPIDAVALEREKINVYIGTRGKLSSKASYNVKVTQQQWVDAPVYILDGTTEYFSFSQGLVNYNRFSALLELSYQVQQKVLVNLSAAYYKYNQDLYINAPVAEINAGFHYNINDKLLAKVNARIVPDRVGLSNTFEGESVRLVVANNDLIAYNDLSVGFEYRYTRRLSAFINFANITGANYLQFPKYSVLGFSALGGLTYSF